jgi:hypothetical protein
LFRPQVFRDVLDRAAEEITRLDPLRPEAVRVRGIPVPTEGCAMGSVRVRQQSGILSFALDEMERFLAGVRADYRDYCITRFLKGLRTAEIDKLK